MKVDDAQHRHVQHICIFGEPFSGKSTLAASLTQVFRRVIWISIDNKHGMLHKLPKEHRDKIELVILPDTRSFPVALATCLKLTTGAKCHICDRHGQVNCSNCQRDKSSTWTDICFNDLQQDECVVYDHISQVADSAMNFVTQGKPDDFKPGWDEYGKQGYLMTRILLDIQAAQYNVICIAHVCETEMEDGSKRLVPLIGTVPFSRNAAKYFDHVIYCRVNNRKHTFGSATTYMASVISGSREDVAIEDLKLKDGERPSLKPFFDYLDTQPAISHQEKRLIEHVKEEVEKKTTEQSQPVRETIVERSESTSELHASNDVGGKETSKTIQESSQEFKPATEQKTEAEISASERAKQLLAKMRGGRI